jgi:pimeloyl-ACP methyl ester carboxylesterase
METTKTSDGTLIAYDVHGEGPVLVDVAGATAHRAVMTNTETFVANLPGHTVVEYDRRGRGDSGDTEPYDTGREIEDLAAVIAAVGGTADVTGHSSGAVLALDAAAAGVPMRRLALYEPPFITDDSRPPVPRDYCAKLDAAAAADDPEECFRIFMVDAVGMPAEAVAGLTQSPFWEQFRKVAHTIRYDARFMEGLMYGDPLPADRWSGVTLPTLVMAGGASPSFMRAGAEQLTGLLPDARYEVLEGQDHGPADDVLGPALLRFLDS